MFDTPLPYRTAWGPYLVTVQSVGEDKRIARLLQVTDRQGHVLREINAYYLDRVDFLDLDGSGSRSLRVVTDPGNNTLANGRTYCLSRRGGLHNVLAMPGGFDQVRDLDGDGRPELLSEDPAPLEWLDGLCHACCPQIFLVLRWNGTRYTVANRRFPVIVLAEVAKKKQRFLADVRHFKNEEADALSWEYLVGEAAGIWADLASVGRQQQACRWLLPRLPLRFMRGRFLALLPEVRRRMAKLPAQVRPEQSRVIHAPSYINDPGDDDDDP